jgi:hypothetical protein
MKIILSNMAQNRWREHFASSKAGISISYFVQLRCAKIIIFFEREEIFFVVSRGHLEGLRI